MDESKMAVCEACGRTFEKNVWNQKYCSKVCRTNIISKRYNEKHKIRTKDAFCVCPTCKRTFRPKTAHDIYCSYSCIMQARKRRKEEAEVAK